jgi:hypothetical protein
LLLDACAQLPPAAARSNEAHPAATQRCLQLCSERRSRRAGPGPSTLRLFFFLETDRSKKRKIYSIHAAPNSASGCARAQPICT